MDPISAAGIALSVISLSFQTFGGCVKAYQAFIEIRELPAASEFLRTRLRIEENRFLICGEKLGLMEETLAGSSKAMQHSANLVADVLAQIFAAFQEASGMFDKLDSLVTADKDSGSRYRSARQSRSAQLRDRALAVWDKSTKLPAKISWVTVKQAKFEKLVIRLVEFNSKMESFLEQSTLDDVRSLQVQSNLMLVQVSQQVQQLHGFISAMNLTPSTAAYDTASLFSGLTLTNDTQSPQGSLADIASFKAYLINAEATTTDLTAWRLSPQHLHYEDEPIDLDADRATFDGQPVWIEWRKSFNDPDILPDLAKVLQERTAKLAAMLSAPDKPQAFRAPLCLGYICDEDEDEGDDDDDATTNDDEESYRTGLIFKIPITKSLPNPQLINLRTLILSRPSLPLNQRLSIATAITESLLYLHAVNWLHKGLRSASIFFLLPSSLNLNSSQEIPSQFLQPVISGFDFSRPDLPDELTTGHPSPPRHLLYKPPALYTSPIARSQKSHDIYALGLILAEIALWSPIETIVNIEIRRTHLPAVWEYMTSGEDVFSRISDRAGTEYAQAVRICVGAPATLGVPPGVAETDVEAAVLMQERFCGDVLGRLKRIKV